MNKLSTAITLYFDESGYTGYNLLDRNQPVFSIASTSIRSERAAEILRSSFPRYQGQEYHFTNIWRSRNREGLRTFCSYLPELSEAAYCYAIIKRFAVLTKIVDFLVEPFMTSSGYDFYDEGFCWRYANYIYFGLTRVAPDGTLDSVLNAYQDFSRDPTAASLSILQRRLHTLAGDADSPAKEFLEQMALGADIFERFHALEEFRSSNNLHTTTMLAVVGHWRQNYTEDFSIVHDASSIFLRDRATWEAVTSEGVPHQNLRIGDGSSVEYPLRVIKTRSVDSRDCHSVQFCDILAGLTARHFDLDLPQEDRVFMDDLIDDGLGSISANRISPGFDFPLRIPPKQLVGPDVIDQMSAILRDRLE